MAEKKKLRIQDLAKIRDKARTMATIPDGRGRAKVTVHMGTCGIVAGAREIMDAVLDEMKKKKATDVIVTTSGCAGLCNREPMATVELKDQPPVKYFDLTPAKMRKISLNTSWAASRRPNTPWRLERNFILKGDH